MRGDLALVEGLRADGADGLGPVYDAYAARLVSYARTLLRDTSAAEDAVHDALLVALARIDQLRDPEHFRSWLFAITRNECLRQLRSRARLSDDEEAIDVIPSTDADLDAGLRARESADLVDQALAALNPGDRDILSLALQHDLDGAEVARVTGTAANDVHARLSRARTQLSVAVTALLLIRGGGRDCPDLAALLAGTAAPAPLTPLLRKRVARHARDCDSCEERGRAAVAAALPASALPALLAAPSAGLRDRLLVSAHDPVAVDAAATGLDAFAPDGFPVAEPLPLPDLAADGGTDGSGTAQGMVDDPSPGTAGNPASAGPAASAGADGTAGLAVTTSRTAAAEPVGTGWPDSGRSGRRRAGLAVAVAVVLVGGLIGAVLGLRANVDPANDERLAAGASPSATSGPGPVVVAGSVAPVPVTVATDMATTDSDPSAATAPDTDGGTAAGSSAVAVEPAPAAGSTPDGATTVAGAPPVTSPTGATSGRGAGNQGTSGRSGSDQSGGSQGSGQGGGGQNDGRGTGSREQGGSSGSGGSSSGSGGSGSGGSSSGSGGSGSGGSSSGSGTSSGGSSGTTTQPGGTAPAAPQPVPAPAPTSPPVPVPAPAPAPPAPSITGVTVTDLDVDAGGSYTRCDAFRLAVTVASTGQVDQGTASAAGVTAPLAPAGASTWTATLTLPPGEHAVAVTVSGPGGSAQSTSATVLHICPG